MKSGFVSLIGIPNVGKSTLLNSIVGHKVAITSNKPQTTRNIIEGIYNDSEAQIIFVDTPGVHKPTHKLGKVLNRQAYYSIDDVDIILFLVDGSEALGPGDKYVLERLKTVNKPVILVINKVDKISKEKILLKIDEYKDLYDFKEIIPLSALKKDNIETVVKVLKKYLKDNIKYYDEDTYTNSSEQFMTAEIIREKVFRTTEEEVPHSVTCVVEKMEFSKNSVNVIASIIVDRDSLKRIIIGKQGSKIKEIGTSAREDIEALLGKKVYLDLYVRCIKKWRDREKYLQEFGYYDFEK